MQDLKNVDVKPEPTFTVEYKDGAIIVDGPYDPKMYYRLSILSDQGNPIQDVHPDWGGWPFEWSKRTLPDNPAPPAPPFKWQLQEENYISRRWRQPASVSCRLRIQDLRGRDRVSLELTISIPVAPEPEYAERYRKMKGGLLIDETRPVLRVEVYDSTDGYGIAGEDMIPGRSISISPGNDFQARLLYLRKGKPDFPMYVYTHERNEGRVHIAWVLADGSERGVNLLPGRTFDLRDVWADGWIIEAD